MIYLYGRLSPWQRDDLLECLMMAAPLGGTAMIDVLEQLLLRHSVEELLEEHANRLQN